MLWPVLQDRGPWRKAQSDLHNGVPRKGCVGLPRGVGRIQPPQAHVTPILPPSAWPNATHMVLLIFQNGSIEGSLFPLLRCQSDLTAEPPEEEDKLGTGMELWALGAALTGNPARLGDREEPHLLAAS